MDMAEFLASLAYHGSIYDAELAVALRVSRAEDNQLLEEEPDVEEAPPQDTYREEDLIKSLNTYFGLA